MLQEVQPKNSVQELRQKGYRVCIKHVRYFPLNGDMVCKTIDGISGDAYRDYEVDQYLTKGEYLLSQENKNLEFSRDGEESPRVAIYLAPWDIPYSVAVSPVGGFTHVEIYKDDEFLASGKRNFGKREHFNRKKGVHGALKQALSKVNIE